MFLKFASMLVKIAADVPHTDFFLERSKVLEKFTNIFENINLIGDAENARHENVAPNDAK